MVKIVHKKAYHKLVSFLCSKTSNVLFLSHRYSAKYNDITSIARD